MVGTYEEKKSEPASDRRGGTRLTALRPLGAGILLGAGVGVLMVPLLGSYGFAETYGYHWDFVVMLGGVFGAAVGLLVVLAKNLAGWKRPPSELLVLIVILVAVAGSAAAGSVGAQIRRSDSQAAASACDEPVGRELEELARVSGRLAQGEDHPNDGVVLQNDSFYVGMSSGICMALVNAALEDVLATATALGWVVESPDRFLSPSGTSVAAYQEPAEPNFYPPVRLEAQRP